MISLSEIYLKLAHFPVKIGLFFLFFFGVSELLIFMLLRSPCKILWSYNNSLCCLSNGGNKRKEEKNGEKSQKKYQKGSAHTSLGPKSTCSLIAHSGQGWFCSFIHEFAAGSCTKQIVEGCPKSFLNSCFFGKK